MAAFTAALIGLALAGGLTAGKKLAGRSQSTDDPNDRSKSPHATLGGGDTPPTPPPSLALTSGNAAQAAGTAAARQRKKAGTGNLLSGPLVNQPGRAAAPQPKTLLGY